MYIKAILFSRFLILHAHASGLLSHARQSYPFFSRFLILHAHAFGLLSHARQTYNGASLHPGTPGGIRLLRWWWDNGYNGTDGIRLLSGGGTNAGTRFTRLTKKGIQSRSATASLLIKHK